MWPSNPDLPSFNFSGFFPNPTGPLPDYESTQDESSPPTYFPFIPSLPLAPRPDHDLGVAASNPHGGGSAGTHTSGYNNAEVSSAPVEAQTAASKLHIDARAAELKERLLRNRSQKSSRDNSATPAIEKVQSGVGQEKKAPPPSTMKSSSTPPFVPHQIPKEAFETSVPADADEISALIASISSASRGQASDKSLQVTKPAVSGSNAKPQPKASESPAKNTTAVNIGDPAQHHAQPAKPAPPASPLEEGEITNSPKQDDDKPNAPAPPTLSQSSRNSNAPTKRSPASLSATTQPHGGRSVGGQDRPLTSAPASHNRDAVTGTGNDRNEPREFFPSSTRYTKSAVKDTRKPDNERAGQPHEPAYTGNRHSINGSASSDLNPEEQLAKLLESNIDLRDWLTLTQYFDKETRGRKLTRYRKLAEMDAEQKRIQAEQQRLEAERQKLLAEEESERVMLWSNTTPTPFPSTPAPVGQNNSASAPSKADNALVSPSPVPSTLNKLSVALPPSSIPGKRESDIYDGENDPHRNKVPRLEDRALGEKHKDPKWKDRNSDAGREVPFALPNQGSGSKYQESRSRASSRDLSPRRYAAQSSPPGRYGGDRRRRSASPSYQPEPFYRRPSNSQAYRSRRDQFEYADYRGDNTREGRQPSLSPRDRPGSVPFRAPKRIDLGDKGDTRFFVVKSFKEENVRRCMEDGLWTTQMQNGDILTSAFGACKNVILFFSVNKSRAFQGYARMATTPSPDTPRPRWMSGIHWETTHPFRLEWLSTTEVEFYRIGHLKNSLNENQPVLVGKDGQEIEDECGRQLLKEMETIAEMKHEMRKLPPPPRRESYGRGSYGYRGGRGGKRYIKQEDDR